MHVINLRGLMRQLEIRKMSLTKQVDDIQFQLQDAIHRADLFNYSIITIEKLKLCQRLLNKIQEQIAIDLKENHGKIQIEENQEANKEVVQEKEKK